MITYLQRLQTERDQLSQLATRTADTAASEDRDMTDTEKRSLADWRTRCDEIDKQLVEYSAQADSLRAYAALSAKLELDDTRPDGIKPAPALPDTRSPGERFVSSDAFLSYRGHGQSARFEVDGFLEMRAPIMTTNLAIPHFQWAPVVYETRAPLLEVCGHVMVSAGVVDWVELGGDPQAAVVAEGAAKPEAAFTATPKSSALDTIAHWVQITRQALDDATYIRSVIEGKLRRGLLNKAEADMAAAIDASTSVQTATGTDMSKAIRAGIGKVEAAGFVPNAVALNPADYAAIDIAAASDSNSGPERRSTFWGLPAVAAQAIPAGKSYVGDFASGAQLFDRGVTSVFVTDSHASLFISNILVILAEARLKSAVTDPLALCECTVTP